MLSANKEQAHFITDKQTLSDLNLLGKYRTGSLFNLFNTVKTRGGELLLEEMFRSPLLNGAAINLRAARIAYLQQLQPIWKISWEYTEQASQYLTEHRPANELSAIFSCYREKTQEVLYRSEKYQLQQKQQHAVQEVLLAASGLLGQLLKKGGNAGGENPVEQLQDRMAQILSLPGLKQLKAKYPYTVRQMAQLQYLFRNKYREQLEELLGLLYELDVYLSVAAVAAQRGLIRAEAQEDGELLLDASNLRHPSLSGAVGNSLLMTGKANLQFLTGANMAGKSTWMKTLGVSFYLAHMGFPVAADRFQFKVMEGIFTSINVPDDISQGWSHFYSEVMRVKLVAEKVSRGKRVFVLFDELFKGTNVKDAYDATLAVTQRLAGYHQCVFVVSTHIIEVGEALKEIPSIRFHYMPTVMESGVPRYTYQLADGITEDKQGMIIIENEGILGMLQ